MSPEIRPHGAGCGKECNQGWTHPDFPGRTFCTRRCAVTAEQSTWPKCSICGRATKNGWTHESFPDEIFCTKKCVTTRKKNARPKCSVCGKPCAKVWEHPDEPGLVFCTKKCGAAYLDGPETTEAGKEPPASAPATIGIDVGAMWNETINKGLGVNSNEERERVLAEMGKDMEGFAIRSAMIDEETCSACRKLDGKIVKVDSPEFEEYLPPRKFRRKECRCFYVGGG